MQAARRTAPGAQRPEVSVFLQPSTTLALALAAGCAPGAGKGGDGGSVLTSEPLRWVEAAQLGARPTAMTELDDGLLLALGEELWESPDGLSWIAASTEGLPPGAITFLGAIPGEVEARLAFVHGRGLYRSTGGDWAAVTQPPDSALLRGLNPRALVEPMDLAVDNTTTGRAWLAAVGGLYRTEDGGETWQPVNELSQAGYNLLYTSVDARGRDLAVVAMRPAGVLPDAYAGLLTGHVFRSTDGGETWWDADPEVSFRYPTGVALDPTGTAWVAAMDGGLYVEDAGGWLAVGGPSDAVDLEWARGGLNVASARRGVWRYQAAGWTAAGTGPVAALTPDHAVGSDGPHWVLESGEGEPPPPAGGATVHVALSMHVNLYHSYRGDTVDDDGYGMDLDVIRDTLAWLDARPQVRCDWDFDNHWSTDSWMQDEGADILDAVARRVAAGTDDVRLMSWNNGAMANHTRAEFDEAIARAWASNQAAFSEVVPGVQPQECMYTPEHLEWYSDQGVEWITLFNSSNPFTALRGEVELPEQVWTNPATIAWQGHSLALVPTYHHGDLLDHGGLRGWVQQLHEAHEDDQLLVIHFDADAESWEGFDAELDSLVGLDFVRFTTIQDYLDQRAPQATLDSPLDMADGSGDGFQSWAEKTFNHEIATGIAQARELAAQAEALAPADEQVIQLLAAALEPRLLALSTTHFGLAAPTLHPDRVQSARGYVAQALAGAQAARDAAEALAPVAPGTLEVRELRGSAGPALVEATLAIPAWGWNEADALVVRDEAGAELPVRIVEVVQPHELDGEVQVRVELVVEVEALQVRTLTWGVEPGHAPATGAATGAGLEQVAGLAAPFTGCDGAEQAGALTDGGHLLVDDRGVRAELATRWSVPLCEEEGVLARTLAAYDGLPGVVVEVDATLPELGEGALALVESVALSPLACDGAATSLRWRSFGDATLERPARQGAASWNGQAVDGWLELACEHGSPRQLSHRVTERTALGLGPLRTLAGQDAVLVPLGTLWGPAPHHDARAQGGHGIGDGITEIIGSQFRPAAPDWAGQRVRYRLLLGHGELDADTLDLFAHPPWVRVGAWDQGA